MYQKITSLSLVSVFFLFVLAQTHIKIEVVKHNHIDLFVKSIENTEIYLKKNKISYHAQVRFDGTKQIYVAAPDNYLIEFNQVKTIN
jgi:hypothetical protein